MNIKMLRRFTLAFLIAGTACSGGETSAGSGQAATTKTAAPPGAKAALDVTTLDVCKLVPVAEVAEALGGTPGAHPPNGHAYPGAESECWYEVARGSGRMPEVVGIFLYPPEFFAGMREDGATEIRNLGDGAFLSPRTDIATVVVLEQGVAVIDARAGDQEHAKAIAELLLGKLKSP
jgi:hypothetical protein